MTSLEVMLQREDVVTEALSWVRTPYAHHARVKGAGVDCGMILAAVYEAAGVLPHVDPGEYVHDWFLHRDEPVYLEIVEKFAAKIDGPPQPGDIAMYQFGRNPAHGAIVIEWPVILHSYQPAGMVILDDAVANKDLAERFVGIWSPWAKKGGAE
jgi:cell wall-associated NlpC family hydrolase